MLALMLSRLCPLSAISLCTFKKRNSDRKRVVGNHSIIVVFKKENDTEQSIYIYLDFPCKLDFIADIQVDTEVQELSHTSIIPIYIHS